MGNFDGNTGCPLGGWPMRIALATALAVALPAHARTISDDTDRISGERTVAYTADGSTDLARPVFTFNASFAGGTSSSAINLAFVSRDEGGGVPAPRFAGCHGVEWIVDGQPMTTTAASHRSNIIDGERIELIGQGVSPEWVAAIGNARTVRYRVCRDEYALTPGDIDAFAVIAAKLKGAVSYASPASRADKPAPSPASEVKYEGMNWRPKGQGTMFPSRD